MIILIFILIFVLVFFIFLRILFNLSFGVKKVHENIDRDVPKYEQYQILGGRILADVDKLLAEPFEPVTITSHDGLKLAGKYYHTEDGKPLIILFHGYHGSAIRDGVGGFRIAKELGYNVLLVHQRAHGESEGRTITMGVKERYDCLEWIRYGIKRLGEDTEVILMGVSMGASTILMASGLDELPEQVRCVLADCGYSSAKAMVRRVMGVMKLPFAPLYPFVRLAAKVYGRFDPDEITTKEALRSCKVPVLLIHGEHDQLVPYEMSYENYEMISTEKQLLIVKEANHGISYYIEQEKYITTIKGFVARYLGA